jgi:hypothetical protein
MPMPMTTPTPTPTPMPHLIARHPISHGTGIGIGIDVRPDRRCRHGRRRSKPESESGSGSGSMFLLGTGFVARHVALPLLKQGWHVSGTCTSSPKLNHLRSLGIDAHLFHASRHPQPQSLQHLRHATHLLVSIPPLTLTVV